MDERSLANLICEEVEKAAKVARLRLVGSLKRNVLSVFEAQVEAAYDFLWDSVRALEVTRGSGSKPSLFDPRRKISIYKEVSVRITEIVSRRLDLVDRARNHTVVLIERERPLKG